MSTNDKLKASFLTQILLEAPYHGWTDKAARSACKKLNYAENFYTLIFPEGLEGVLSFYMEKLDQEMIAIYQKKDFSTLRTHERIFEMLVIRLTLINKSRVLLSKILVYLAIPWNIPFSLKCAFRVVDKIWIEAGKDTSTDFNYYTKRGLLMMVYSSTLKYMAIDETPSLENTTEFMRRRFEQVLKMGKGINTIKGNIRDMLKI